MKDSIPISSISNSNDSTRSLSDTIAHSNISLFETPIGQITVQERAPQLENNLGDDWLSLSFLGVIIYLIIVRFLFNFNFSESFRGLFKIESIDEVSYEKSTNNAAYILAPISAIVYAFYVYFFINPDYLRLDLDYLFLVFGFIISALFVFKILLEKIISLIFNSPKAFKAYFSDHLYLLGISGILQLPFIIIYVYSGILLSLWISLSILVLLWGFRLLRGLVIGYSQSRFSKSYIFLYLCILEILPIIWACKWLFNNQ